MKNDFLAALGLITHFLGGPAFSTTNNAAHLLAAKTIRCSLDSGHTSTFDGKDVSFEKGDFAKKPEDRVVTFAKINLQSGTAIAIGNAGSDDVVVKGTEIGLNFIDITEAGAIIVMTIFNNKSPDGRYFIVSSRHTQIFLGRTTSLPSQWTGFCKIIE